MPKRLQLRRSRGWRKPEGAIVVSRPGPYGNPYKVGTTDTPSGKLIDRGLAFNLFRDLVMQIAFRDAFITKAQPLKGHDLLCWCPLDANCHADIWLLLANAPDLFYSDAVDRPPDAQILTMIGQK